MQIVARVELPGKASSASSSALPRARENHAASAGRQRRRRQGKSRPARQRRRRRRWRNRRAGGRIPGRRSRYPLRLAGTVTASINSLPSRAVDIMPVKKSSARTLRRLRCEDSRSCRRAPAAPAVFPRSDRRVRSSRTRCRGCASAHGRPRAAPPRAKAGVAKLRPGQKFGLAHAGTDADTAYGGVDLAQLRQPHDVDQQPRARQPHRQHRQ